MAFIYNLTDTWNDAATTWNGIKLAVTNSGSDASSKLLNLTVSGATTASFVVDKSGNLALNGTVNKITMTAPATGATLTLADGSTFATSGAYSATFTFSGTTTLTFPTSGTVTALGNTTTGSGSIVLATSPTITSPTITSPTISSATLSSPTITGSASFNGASSGSVAVKAPAVAGSTTFQLPSGNGTSGYVLVTDGLGNTSWAASGGAVGSAAGLNKNVQFNDAGSMAGNAAFNFDKATAALSLGVASTTTGSFALYNSASANSVTIKSGNNSAAWTMTLPTSAGTNQYFLQTDGSGNTIWAAAAAGTINTGTIGQITYYSGTNALSGTTTGTGVLTALGNNTNTAGGVLVPAAALTANALVIGGGSGTGPSTTTTGAGIITFLGTPSSANLASAVTDETGSGSLVFGTSPTLTTPRIAGSSTGYTSLASANSSASNYTVTFPAETMTVGFRNIPPVGTQTGTYSLGVGDVGKYVQIGTGGTITIPNSTFAEGDVVSVFNNTTGSINITVSTTTGYIAGTNTNKSGGTVALATRGVATILFISGTVCVISGNVS